MSLPMCCRTAARHLLAHSYGFSCLADRKCSPYVPLRKSETGKSKLPVRQSLRIKAIGICNDKIAKKGETVGLSFYAFFANKNDDPELLMEAAEWWIKTHELDHFEKATKIRDMMRSGD
ncbi:DUF6500 family protein [Sagittula sp. NFXS13]|uniref:DUF6500 family protein n=1 Tax=Sagittula sp. NFXS13 TaxID=2819095 RepID=UPI0032DF57BA